MCMAIRLKATIQKLRRTQSNIPTQAIAPVERQRESSRFNSARAMGNELSTDSDYGWWNAILSVVRSLIVGVLVTETGLITWLVLLVTLPPLVACAAMLGALLVYGLFFSGKILLPASMPWRRERFRQRSLSKATWVWGLSAAALFVVAIESAFFTLFRLTPFPAEQFHRPELLERATTLELWTLAIVAALVAGVCEETGFRGYLQRPLELRFGPAKAIVLTTVGFAALHVNQAWVLTLMAPLLLASVMLGMLAYAARSLVPGMIGHAAMDVFNFSYWWWHLWGDYDRRPISETGIDLDFVTAAATLVISLSLFVVVVQRLFALRPQCDGLRARFDIGPHTE
jgi:membrane protease YdiL (CAAX protease family)